MMGGRQYGYLECFPESGWQTESPDREPGGRRYDIASHPWPITVLRGGYVVSPPPRKPCGPASACTGDRKNSGYRRDEISGRAKIR